LQYNFGVSGTKFYDPMDTKRQLEYSVLLKEQHLILPKSTRRCNGYGWLAASLVVSVLIVIAFIRLDNTDATTGESYSSNVVTANFSKAATCSSSAIRVECLDLTAKTQESCLLAGCCWYTSPSPAGCFHTPVAVPGSIISLDKWYLLP
jgi:hypothetical protein